MRATLYQSLLRYGPFLLPRGVAPVIRTQTARSFSCLNIHRSGHSRWSKIKHDKAKTDAKVNKQRSQLSKEIELASKEGSPDPNFNPRLAAVIAAAKKAGFPKASLEAAVARGQGRSPSGAVLEPMVLEILHSGTGVAGIIDCLTDNKAKTLQDIRERLKANGAAQAPVGYMFERRGRLLFRDVSQDGRKLVDDDMMDAALAAGALDIEFSEASENEDEAVPLESIVYTAPTEMTAVTAAMAARLGTGPAQADLVWFPKEDTMVEAGDSGQWDQVGRLVDQLEADWVVTGVYLNAK